MSLLKTLSLEFIAGSLAAGSTDRSLPPRRQLAFVFLC